ncbi:hypothetical protein [Rhodomicrobium vannielii]|uniref:hypothetical protein n=1 Tax=Rhodomicrobium vannielii TaxID=1069 RepID=UPI00191ADA3A|nr:hypothetical protein [Rhodomicrobium vannielii]
MDLDPEGLREPVAGGVRPKEIAGADNHFACLRKARNEVWQRNPNRCKVPHAARQGIHLVFRPKSFF